MANQLINLGSTQAPYWEVEKTITAGQRVRIDYVTDLFQLLYASQQSALRVSFGGSQVDTHFSAGMGYRLSEPVQFIELFNDSINTLTVRFVLGIGEVRDSRLTVSGIVNTDDGRFNINKITGETETGQDSFQIDGRADVSISVLTGNVIINVNDLAGLYAINNVELAAGGILEFSVNSYQTVVDISGTASDKWSILITEY